MVEVAIGLAIGAPILQVALMGFIGYPMSRGSASRMARFHKSGFQWWLIALGLVVIVGLVVQPQLLTLTEPSKYDVTALRAIIGFALGLSVLVGIELLAERLRLAWGPGPDGAKHRERYESGIPKWARTPPREALVLTTTAVIEEAVYRGIVLVGAITVWGLSEPLAAALSAGAFGAAHWYFGGRQIILKSLIGAVLVTIAFSSGWIVAAAAHVGLNLVLLVMERRTR